MKKTLLATAVALSLSSGAYGFNFEEVLASLKASPRFNEDATAETAAAAPAQSDINALFNYFDRDSSGLIKRFEFIRAWGNVVRAYDGDTSSISSFDAVAGDDAAIDASEFRSFATSLLQLGITADKLTGRVANPFA